MQIEVKPGDFVVKVDGKELKATDRMTTGVHGRLAREVEGIARNPGAAYYLAQTVIMQEQALNAAQAIGLALLSGALGLGIGQPALAKESTRASRRLR